MKKLVVVPLIGLPGSGKTTFCQMLISFCRVQEYRRNIIYIGFDDLIKLDKSLIEKGLFKETRQRYIILVRKVIEAVIDADFNELRQFFQEEFNIDFSEFLSKGIFTEDFEATYVMVDDNNYYRSMRYSFFQIARDLRVAFAQLSFHSSIDVIKQRNSNRKCKVDETVIDSMACRLEIPIKTNAWEKNTIAVNTTTPTDIKQVIEYLDQFSQLPESPSQAITKRIIKQSEVHELDLLLRKTMHQLISLSSESASRKSLLAKSLQEKRKSILQDLRDGVIDFHQCDSIDDCLKYLKFQ